jgi:excisionase family DNA binding protein
MKNISLDTLPHQLVGPDFLAKKLMVSRNTVLNWSREGKLPAIKIGRTYRFSIEKVAKFLELDSSYL